MMQFNR